LFELEESGKVKTNMYIQKQKGKKKEITNHIFVLQTVRALDITQQW